MAKYFMSRLIYLIGEPHNPKEVWTKLENQFQKKSWANKLSMRRKLHSLRLKEGDSVQDHIIYIKHICLMWSWTRVITDRALNICALSVMEAPLSEEDRVIYLLASLPESVGVLVTALEASSTVPTMDVVTERLLHEERKKREKEESPQDEKAMMSQPRKFYGHCYHCGKLGHLKRDCPGLHGEWGQRKEEIEAIIKTTKFTIAI